MADKVTHYIQKPRVVYEHFFTNPEDLPYYYFQAKKFSFALVPLTEEVCLSRTVFKSQEKGDVVIHVQHIVESKKNKPGVKKQPPKKKQKTDKTHTSSEYSDQAVENLGCECCSETKAETRPETENKTADTNVSQSTETQMQTGNKPTEISTEESTSANMSANKQSRKPPKQPKAEYLSRKSRRAKVNSPLGEHLRSQTRGERAQVDNVVYDRDGAPFNYKLLIQCQLWPELNADIEKMVSCSVCRTDSLPEKN